MTKEGPRRRPRLGSQKKLHPESAIVEEGVPHRRSRSGRHPARCPPKSGVLPTAHGLPACSNEGEDASAQRPPTPSACPRHGSDARHPRTRGQRSATCTTTTCRRRTPTAEVGPRWAARSDAKIGHGSASPEACACSRSCRARRTSRTRLRGRLRGARIRNGSTSMGSVCGIVPRADGRRCVPIKAPVAGIAMGPRLRRRQVHDAHRHPSVPERRVSVNMDFKVAGTADFVTAVAARHEDRRSAGPTCSPRHCSRPTKPACRSSRS